MISNHILVVEMNMSKRAEARISRMKRKADNNSRRTKEFNQMLNDGNIMTKYYKDNAFEVMDKYLNSKNWR